MYEPPFERKAAGKPLDGDVHAITLLDQTPELGLRHAGSSGPQILDSGRAINPQHLPGTIQLGGPRSVVDYEGRKGLLCISSAFKAVIDRLEPELHQFFPVRLVDKRGKHLADHWFWVVCNRIDSVDREHTSLIFREYGRWVAPADLADDESPSGFDRSQPIRLVFNLGQIGGAHFWRDKYLLPGDLYCSYEARDAIAEAELTGIRLLLQEYV
jgi:hypothetical protein